MKFPKMTLRLISVRSIEKEGKGYNFVKLANELTYESNDFMLGRETDVKMLTVQTRYNAELDVDGRFLTVNLTPESNPTIESITEPERKKAS